MTEDTPSSVENYLRLSSTGKEGSRNTEQWGSLVLRVHPERPHNLKNWGMKRVTPPGERQVHHSSVPGKHW